mmetsp:Transcript_11684/g.26749  ORF Transcript_11684/g.26749 Transcript_11684/m.26749 type:complete len:93 (+) Transcript_11684:226-504(+)
MFRFSINSADEQDVEARAEMLQISINPALQKPRPVHRAERAVLSVLSVPILEINALTPGGGTLVDDAALRMADWAGERLGGRDGSEANTTPR